MKHKLMSAASAEAIEPSPMMELPPRLTYSVDEFSAAAGWSRATTYNLMRAGRLPFLQQGTRRYIRVEAGRQLLIDIERETTERLAANRNDA